MKIFLLLLVCYLPFGHGRGFPVRKLDILCDLDQEICDTKCYNPAAHKCLTTQGGLHQICTLDQTLCGNECWTESGDKACTLDAGGIFANVCDPGELSCGWRCYKPEDQECFDSQWLCPKGQLTCGGQCYSPSDPVKCIRTQYGNTLCKTNEEACGSWGCYNPKEKSCFKERDMLCQVGEELCGRNCYNPSAGDTCHNGTYYQVVCKAGEQYCKNSCYDPNKGKICANNERVCNTGEVNCGDQGCYVASSGAQCFEARSDYHVVCEKGEDYCHYNCYKPATEVCLTAGEDYKKICPIGHQICNGQLNHHTWGYGCYDPATSACLKNSQNSKVLCRKGESLCGTTCYTSADDGLVCRENGVLCKPDQELCGHRCFDSGTKKCFKNVVSDIQWGG